MATNSKEAQRRYDAARSPRSRCYAGVLYTDSAPSDWLTRLNSEHIQALISPLHDSDITEDGKPKKEHYHVMLMYDSPVPFSTAEKVFQLIGAVPERYANGAPKPIKSAKGYARYLVHMDDHDKHRYDEKDVIEVGGCTWAAVALGNDELVNVMLDEIEAFIDERKLTTYRMLCKIAREEYPDWVRVIRSHTFHLTAYLKSAEYEQKKAWVEAHYDDSVM